MPVFCSYSGATALRAASSLPWTAAMVSFAGFCAPPPPVVDGWHALIRSAATTSADAHCALLMCASSCRWESREGPKSCATSLPWTRPIPPGPGVIVRSEGRTSRTLEVSVANDPHLRVSHVTKRFGGVTAVDDVSFDVPRGSFATLLGPSGCGKTTTLRMIAGFYEPDAGDIELAGKRINNLPAHRRGAAMVFQDYALFPHMSVRANVGYGLRLQRKSKADIAKKVDETLKFVGLAGLGDRQPNQLSGGQQQRVAVARALVVEPQILLLDEPLSNLDAKLREEMRFEIRRLHETFGITTLYVTHDQAEAMVISDRIAVLDRGRVAQVGSAEEIFQQPRTRFVADFIGRTNLVDAVAATPDAVTRGALRLRVASADLTPGARVSVSIRPHEIALATSTEGHAGDNVVSGRVRRVSYLGDAVDYQIELADSDVVLRVAAAPVLRLRAGEAVRLTIPPSACVPLPE